MTVTWTIRNAAGQVVDTHLADAALPAGPQSWRFYGKTADGTMLPRGRYTSVVTASDGTLSATQSVWFDSEAFRFALSDSTPGRGQSIKVTVTSAETLSARPRMCDLPAGHRTLERAADEDRHLHVQGHHPDEVERQVRDGRAQGEGLRHQGRQPVDDGDLQDPLGQRERRATRRGARTADRTGPHRTAPEAPVLLRTGTIEP